MKKVSFFLSMLAFIGLSVFALFGCKKESATQRPEFIGYWRNPFSYDFVFTIYIYQNGYGDYTELNKEGDRLHIKGDARVTDEKLKIGCLHHFRIIEYPHKIDTTDSDIFTTTYEGLRKKANWKMILEAPHFYAGSSTYYKADY